MKTPGDLIDYLCDLSGLKQKDMIKEMEKAINIKARTILSWKHLKWFPDELLKYADKKGIPLGWLNDKVVGDRKSLQAVHGTVDVTLEDFVSLYKIMTEYNKLDRESRKKVQTFIHKTYQEKNELGDS